MLLQPAMSKKFEELESFKRARLLLKDVYLISGTFPHSEVYGLTAQMRRAAVSVISQMAEGQGRLSYGEWRQMLSQARGSLFEVDSQTIAALDLGFLGQESYDALRARVASVGRPLSGLIKYVQRREAEAKRRKPPGTSHQAPATDIQSMK